MPEREPVVEAYARVPHELRALPQWVNWSTDEESKVPINPKNLNNAGVIWQNTWTGFERARQNSFHHGLGLGFVLTEADPYACIDLDKCVLPGGQIEDDTQDILDLLSGWVELSPSGTGLHIWVKSDLSVNRRSKEIEIYSSKRWMTITGRSNPMGPAEIPERTEAVATLLDMYFPEPVRNAETTPTITDGDGVWAHLFDSPKGAFYRSLYIGDLSVCYGDHSRAVILLANQLATLTNCDSEQMRQLLYETGLVRDKWAEKRGAITWIEYQIQDAIAYISGRRRQRVFK